MNLRWMILATGLLLSCDKGLPLGDPRDAGGTGTGGTGASAATGGVGAGPATGGVGAGGSVAGTGGTAGSGVIGDPDGGMCPIKATCSTPAGMVQNTFSGQAEVYSIFVGKWQICAGGDISFPGIPSDAIGVEYDAPPDLASDGNMYYLVAGPDGPVRGQGFAYQLTYNLYPEGPNSYQLDMYQNGGFGGQWRYSPCPKELQIGQIEGSGEALLVPF
ncbi:MAG TPA: hypothetical protein VMT03_07975 [Polyangia bacterium]|nr:hypothetical protein [Polyangia bacterium]